MTVSHHRYPASALRGDYLRATAGVALCGFPFLVTPLSTVAAVILGGLTLVFATHGVRTWLRGQDTVVMDDTGLTMGVLYRRNLAWHDLGKLKLRYFSTRRDRSGGWMQLALTGRGFGVGVDSELEGFVDICRRARDAARENGLDLNESTIRNFQALGLDAADMAPDSDIVARSTMTDDGKKGWGDPAGWRR